MTTKEKEENKYRWRFPLTSLQARAGGRFVSPNSYHYYILVIEALHKSKIDQIALDDMEAPLANAAEQSWNSYDERETSFDVYMRSEFLVKYADDKALAKETIALMGDMMTKGGDALADTTALRVKLWVPEEEEEYRIQEVGTIDKAKLEEDVRTKAADTMADAVARQISPDSLSLVFTTARAYMRELCEHMAVSNPGLRRALILQG